LAFDLQYGRAMNPRMLRAIPLVLALAVVACGSSSTTTPTGPSTAPPPSSGGLPPVAAGCTVTTVAGLPVAVGPTSGRFPFTITVGPGCVWSARTDVSWADVAPGAGQGSASATLTIGDNPGRDTRTVGVTVNGQLYFVVQQAPGCSYSVSPATLDIAAGGGSAVVSVVAPTGCGWTAASSESWIRVVTPTGSGSAGARFDIAANIGDVRHAFVVVAGQQVPVTQQKR
jgi:hypothetical protein